MNSRQQTRLKISFIARLFQTKIDHDILCLGISGAQSLILEVIYAKEKCTQKEIAEYLKVSTSAITKALKTLKEKGLITKEQSQNDLRANYITLTSDGIAITKQIVAIIKQVDEKSFNNIFSLDLEQFNQCLDKMNENLQVDREHLDYKQAEFESLYSNYQGEKNNE